MSTCSSGLNRATLRRIWNAPFKKQRRAVDEAPARSGEQPRLLAELADSLASQAGPTATPDDVAQVHPTYRRVIDLGRSSVLEQALGADLRWGSGRQRGRAGHRRRTRTELGLAVMTQ